VLVILWWGCSDEEPPHIDRSVDRDTCDVPGNICTWVGVPGEAEFSDETTHRLETRLYLPIDLAFDAGGIMYLSDFNHHRIRQVDLAGMVSTLSGTGLLGDGPGGFGTECWEGCDAAESTWNLPSDVFVDPVDPDKLWVAAAGNRRIKLIDLAESTVWWVAGSGAHDYVDGPAQQAAFYYPSSVVADEDGTLYVADLSNHVIRKITPEGEVSTFAGQPGVPGFAGDGGPASQAYFHGNTWGMGSKLALDGRRLLLTDTFNGVIRAIDLDTEIVETVAGAYLSAGSQTMVHPITGVSFEADSGSVPGFGGDGGDALQATLCQPQDVAVGPDGAIYIADTGNHCVRVVRDGVISTFAGTCTEDGFAGDGGPADQARLDEPWGLTVDRDGAVYVTDTLNQVIRRVAP
jgi:sugar lactone lactonase YvrE